MSVSGSGHLGCESQSEVCSNLFVGSCPFDQAGCRWAITSDLDELERPPMYGILLRIRGCLPGTALASNLTGIRVH